MINLLLLFIAIILSAIIFPIALVYSILTRGFNTLGKDSWNTAIAIDQLGNVWCKHILNDFCIKPNGYRFGDPNQTVSHVLGVNKSLGTLYNFGKFVAWVLNKIERNHVEKAKDNKQ